MKTVTEFMTEFILARNCEEEKYLKERADFRRRFFTEECDWDSRNKTFNMNKAEAIVTVEESALEARVVTMKGFPLGSSWVEIRLRYHLVLMGGMWLIRCVDTGCPACGGRGCIVCKGTQWISGEPNEM